MLKAIGRETAVGSPREQREDCDSCRGLTATLAFSMHSFLGMSMVTSH